MSKEMKPKPAPARKVYADTPEDIAALEDMPVGTLALSRKGGVWRRNTLGWTNVYVAPGEPILKAVGARFVVNGREVKIIHDGGSW